MESFQVKIQDFSEIYKLIYNFIKQTSYAYKALIKKPQSEAIYNNLDFCFKLHAQPYL